MGTLAAMGVGASVLAGLVLIAAGMRRRIRRPVARLSSVNRVASWWHHLTRRQRLWLGIAAAIGVIVAVATGWLAAIVLIPAAALLIPYLLSAPPNREVELLAALDRWVRFLSPSIGTGKSIRDAILATRSQVPPVLAEPVARLVARVDLGWSTHDALLAMADELNSADADGVLAALALASARGGVGGRTMLEALAANAQQRLQALREITAERAKPRAVARQVVIITLGILALVWWLSPGYFTPYTTPIGQVIAIGLATAYLAALAMLRRRTIPRPAARFLRGQ